MGHINYVGLTESKIHVGEILTDSQIKMWVRSLRLVQRDTFQQSNNEIPSAGSMKFNFINLTQYF